jgi:hypothetical protein
VLVGSVSRVLVGIVIRSSIGKFAPGSITSVHKAEKEWRYSVGHGKSRWCKKNAIKCNHQEKRIHCI